MVYNFKEWKGIKKEVLLKEPQRPLSIKLKMKGGQSYD